MFHPNIYDKLDWSVGKTRFHCCWEQKERACCCHCWVTDFLGLSLSQRNKHLNFQMVKNFTLTFKTFSYMIACRWIHLCVYPCCVLGQNSLPPCSSIYHYHILLTIFCSCLPWNLWVWTCWTNSLLITTQHNIISCKLDYHTFPSHSHTN